MWVNISMPTVLLIQGQAAIIKERLGLDVTNDPPFSAMIAIDDQSVTASIGVNIKVPENTGKILVLDALAEMGFFYHNPDAWYFNVGTKEKPVQGRIFKDVFDIKAYSYLMINAAGIDTGAGISFYKKAKAGPLSAELKAYIDIYGKIAFKPVQVGAGISLGGSVDLRIWKFGLKVSAAASLTAEVPHPFIIEGDIEACIRVLKKDRCITFSFTWIFDNQLNISELELHDNGVGELPQVGAMAQNVMSLETFKLKTLPEKDIAHLSEINIEEIDVYIPVDCKINIEFLKAVDTSLTNKFGSLNSSADASSVMIPPKKGKLNQVKHKFFVENVTIYYYDAINSPPEWKEYNVFEAIKPIAPSIVTTPKPLKILIKRH